MSRVVRLLTFCAIFAISVSPIFADTRVVTSNLDTATPGTLRQALADAASGACLSPCTITFAAGMTINTTGNLPVTSNVFIDGFSAPGSSPNTAAFPAPDNAVRNVIINGPSNTCGCTGFTMNGNGAHIQGLVISSVATGVRMDGSTNLLTGSQISSTLTGVDVNTASAASGNVVGGGSPADRNIISGNQFEGIKVDGSYINAFIEGNFIGTNAAGTGAVPNGWGVRVLGSSTGTAIGSSVGNLIAGNTSGGIAIGIGTNFINANLIGATGLGNSGPGIQIGGGVSTIQGNSIRNNSGDGVEVRGGTSDLRDNAFQSNGGIGIDLMAFTLFDGPNTNDDAAGDADSGGNGLQNHPVIEQVNFDPAFGQVNVRFSFNSQLSGNAAVSVELWEASTDGEGLQFIASQCWGGQLTFTNHWTNFFAGPIAIGDSVVMTATAYSDTGCTTLRDGTSEFSPPATVILRPGIVVNTNDSGPGSLRQAMLDANSGVCDNGFGQCFIDFAIPPSFMGGDGTFTIQPATPLPILTRSNTVIDGSSQGSFGGDTNPGGPEIVLNGGLLGPSGVGIAVKPLAPGAGDVEGIQIGFIVINGFGSHGILFEGLDPVTHSQFHTVRDCYIGTNATGTAAVGNGSGITMSRFSSFNTVGGGLVGRPQAGQVRRFDPSPLGLVGFGTNIISGNTVGITMLDSFSNDIRSNKIGEGNGAALPNTDSGIRLMGASQQNKIGGPAAFDSNTIAFNGTYGIAVEPTATQNRFENNSIHSNGSLGIDLFPGGPNANDAGDADTGANNLQNFPVLTSRTEAGGQTTITGTLNSTPLTDYWIEVYASTAPDPTGFGEGETRIDAQLISTDAAGNATFTTVATGSFRWVSATATNLTTFDTSEFSAVANQLPIAVNDSAATTEPNPVTIPVLANDSDPDGDPITIVTWTAVTGGTVTCTPTDCTFTPTPGFSGVASFVYTIADPAGGTANATVLITVAAGNLPPVANRDTATTPSGTPVTINVLANDSDPESGALTITAFTQGTNGTVSCVTPNCTYTPNPGFVGNDTFTYTISDPGGLTAVGTVAITVTNQAPIAVNDTGSTTSGTPVTINVLANDSDPEGQPISIVSSSAPGSGTAVCSTPNCTYTPAPGFTGTDSFTYTITDSLGAAATATVTITVAAVNRAPVVNNDTASVSAGQSVTINVLANDFDPDGDSLSVVGNTQGSQGNVVCTTTGNCTYTAFASASGTDSFSYDVSDGRGGIVRGTVIINISRCPTNAVALVPRQDATNVPVAGMFEFTGDGSTFEVFYGPAGQGCQMSQASTPSRSVRYAGLQPDTLYEWRVESQQPGCPPVSSECVRFRTERTCTVPPPTLLSPGPGARVGSPITFSWTAVPGATLYRIFSVSGTEETLIGQTTATTLTANLDDGATSWFVVAVGVPNCGDLRSNPVSFTICNAPRAPIPAIVGESTSGQTYTLSWTAIAGASRYEVQEANNASFNNPTTFTTTALSMDFTKTAETRAQPFFYIVRAFSECFGGYGSPSVIVRVVVVPIPPRDQPNTSANTPLGSERAVALQVFVPGTPGQTQRFTARGDQPWMTVRPDSGTLPPEGVTLEVLVNPSDLPNGTFTGTVIVEITDNASGDRMVTHTAGTVQVPVSINLVTPVVPLSPGPPTNESLIIPAVGHLDGADARWRSDIRIANIGSTLARYIVAFTPADQRLGIRQTTIEVNPGTTTALDDVVRAWYGIGSLGESSAGVLEVRPVSGPQRSELQGDLPNVSLATVVSSRTYAQTQQGTLGEFIPGVLFQNFVGLAQENQPPSVLNLQQIAQNEAYRTNIGLVEALGQPVSAMVSIFNSAGTRLREVRVDLAPNQQVQLNSLLAQQGLTLSDGRVEVRVLGGEGRLTAYAAVIDNRTRDQLFVPATTLGERSSSRYVVPGVADLNTGSALWRTDMRLFNSGAASETVTLTLHPLNNASAPRTATATIQPGEVEVLDNVVQSVFGTSGIGGAVHVDTAAPSKLVVTGRTYNQTPTGTLGLFIPAVTPAEAIGSGDRALNIVQAEDSVRFRTNLGLAEVTGNPVTVEVQVHVPGSLVTPRFTIPLRANEFKQIPILQALGIGNVYNARVTMRVTEGSGRVTAYGSVIDMRTNDSTYVPAQ